MRLDPIGDADWPEALGHLRGGFLASGNVYRVMAHHPALLAAWEGYRRHVVTESALGRERSEVVILRVAHRLGSDYEWAHHVVRGRAAGLSDARIRALAGAPEGMEAGDATIARAVDALLGEARVPEPLLAELGALLGPEGVLDLMATVGLYATLAFIVKTFATPVDAAVAEELARRPLA